MSRNRCEFFYIHKAISACIVLRAWFLGYFKDKQDLYFH